MAIITLNNEQAEVVRANSQPIDVRDVSGRTVGRLLPLDAIDLEVIECHQKSRSQAALGIPSAQVQSHFRRLEEMLIQQGMDEKTMLDLLSRMQAGEAV